MIQLIQKTELRPKWGKCDKSFSHELTLKRHIKTAHGCPILYLCDECGADFRRRDALTKHMQTVHYLHGNLKCKMCGE